MTPNFSSPRKRRFRSPRAPPCPARRRGEHPRRARSRAPTRRAQQPMIGITRHRMSEALSREFEHSLRNANGGHCLCLPTHVPPALKDRARTAVTASTDRCAVLPSYVSLWVMTLGHLGPPSSLACFRPATQLLASLSRLLEIQRSILPGSVRSLRQGVPQLKCDLF